MIRHTCRDCFHSQKSGQTDAIFGQTSEQKTRTHQNTKIPKKQYFFISGQLLKQVRKKKRRPSSYRVLAATSQRQGERDQLPDYFGKGFSGGSHGAEIGGAMRDWALGDYCGLRKEKVWGNISVVQFVTWFRWREEVWFFVYTSLCLLLKHMEYS